MIVRVVVIAALVVLGALFLWHPAPRPALQSASASPVPSAAPRSHSFRRAARGDRDAGLIVYVAGAVRTPGLYHLHEGDRVARAVALAGGMRGSANAGGVNLAHRPEDGDEIYVPAAGETQPPRSGDRHGHRRSPSPPATASIDVNRAASSELAAVPGIGRALAARIVELREREGNFASLDELLDVAGMTQTRLERARPYLREP
jgi:competence protein ComEA